MQQLPELSQVLHICFKNGLYAYYYHFYLNALNTDRFSRAQDFVNNLLFFMSKTASILDLYLFAFQLSFALLDCNKLLVDMFKFFMNGLLDTKKHKPQGQERIAGYFLMLLLTILYGRVAIVYDEKYSLTQAITSACCYDDSFTFDDILEVVSGAIPEDKLGDYLKELTTSSFNVAHVNTQYSLKKEVIDQMLVYNYNPTVVKNYNILNVTHLY